METKLTGKFICIVGPTGVGKNTLINYFIEKNPGSRFGLSATTRPPREGEVNGVSYYFLSKDEFEEKINNCELLEYAFVHYKFYYGILKKPVYDALLQGEIILKDIEYKGFLNLKKILPSENFLSVFIMPPEKEIMRKRLKERSHISEEEIENRLKYMEEEISVKDMCDIAVTPVDGDIEKSCKIFEEVILKNI